MISCGEFTRQLRSIMIPVKGKRLFDRYEAGEQAVLVHVNFSDEGEGRIWTSSRCW